MTGNLRADIEALASGPDHHLVLSKEPERTEVRMDGSSPYGLRYTGEPGAFALVYQTPDRADRLRSALAAQPHVSVARLRAILDAHPAEESAGVTVTVDQMIDAWAGASRNGVVMGSTPRTFLAALGVEVSDRG